MIRRGELGQARVNNSSNGRDVGDWGAQVG